MRQIVIEVRVRAKGVEGTQTRRRPRRRWDTGGDELARCSSCVANARYGANPSP